MLRPKSIDEIRDLAIRLEMKDIEAAHALMDMAHSARPDGPYIKQKLRQYKQTIKAEKDHILNLSIMNRVGAAAIIPIGFRCFTADFLRRRIGISQHTNPFDVGFFPPASAASILSTPEVSLSLQERASFDICQKHENYNHPIHGTGIRFCRSSKKEIDIAVSRKEQSNLNQYLDSTFGYYTLDNQHSYILAHYNWHAFAGIKEPGECIDMAQNLRTASNTLNRRIQRMMDACHAAKIVIFVFHNPQNYKHMLIDDKMFDLEDLSLISEAAAEAFKAKAHVVTDIELIESAGLRERVAYELP